MEVWQTLEFIWDSQIKPFIELNTGLDNIINQFRQTLYVELPVLGPPGAIPNSPYKVCLKSIKDVVKSHVEFFGGSIWLSQINSSVCHISTGYQRYTKPHVEAILSLPLADVLPHWFRKYSPRAWA